MAENVTTGSRAKELLPAHHRARLGLGRLRHGHVSFLVGKRSLPARSLPARSLPARSLPARSLPRGLAEPSLRPGASVTPVAYAERLAPPMAPSHKQRHVYDAC